MSRRQLFYVRVALALFGLGLTLAGVLLYSGPAGYLGTILAITGVLLLGGLYVVGRVERAARDEGFGKRR